MSILKEDNKTALIEIGRLISDNDPQVEQELSECVTDTKSYFRKYEDRFAERCITGAKNEKIIRWIGLTDCLIENGYACELDYNFEKEDFLYNLNKLKNIIEIDEEQLLEDGDVTIWCEIVNSCWKDSGYQLAALDIDSDSFVLFIISRDNFKKAAEYAKEIGERIDFGENM